jgi:hypothetical protein
MVVKTKSDQASYDTINSPLFRQHPSPQSTKGSRNVDLLELIVRSCEPCMGRTLSDRVPGYYVQPDFLQTSTLKEFEGESLLVPVSLRAGLFQILPAPQIGSYRCQSAPSAPRPTLRSFLQICFVLGFPNLSSLLTRNNTTRRTGIERSTELELRSGDATTLEMQLLA